jgi:hypothetical protein
VKALVLATLVGGAGGLWLGRDHISLTSRDRLLAEGRVALIGDRKVSDLRRALSAVKQVLDIDPNDREAVTLNASLRKQLRCRGAVELGEHALANGDLASAMTDFRDVMPECELYDFAQRRLEELDATWGLHDHPYSAGAIRPAMR